MVRVADHEVDAQRVVVAAGTETPALLQRLGFDVPVDASPAFLVSTEPRERLLRGVAYVYPARGPAIHVRQHEDGRFLIGEGSQESEDPDPSTGHAELLLDQAKQAFPALAYAKLDQVLADSRPLPADRLPIVGSLPGLDLVYVAAASAGVTLAPALAEMVATEIVDGVSIPDLEPFRPARFSGPGSGRIGLREITLPVPPEVFLG